MNRNILIIDDDVSMVKQLTEYFSQHALNLQSSHHGEHGMKLALNQPFDAIILEVILPQCNGFEILKMIRQHQTTPIIFLSSREDSIDVHLALKLGADDFVHKPFNPFELVMRLETIMRRTQKPVIEALPFVSHKGIHMDRAQRTLSMNDQILELTNTEFNILEVLISFPEQAFSKDELTEYGLGRKFTAYDRSIDVHISNLRNKMGKNKKNEQWIKTVRGFGYQLNGG